MKKLMIIAALAFGMNVQATAQSAIKMPTVVGDTLTNAGTVTKTLPALTGAYAGVMLQTVLTKLSGTAAGTVQLYGSLDGVNYVPVDSVKTITNVTTQSFLHVCRVPIVQYLRLIYTGSGTQSTKTTTLYKLTQR